MSPHCCFVWRDASADFTSDSQRAFSGGMVCVGMEWMTACRLGVRRRWMINWPHIHRRRQTVSSTYFVSVDGRHRPYTLFFLLHSYLAGRMHCSAFCRNGFHSPVTCARGFQTPNIWHFCWHCSVWQVDEGRCKSINRTGKYSSFYGRSLWLVGLFSPIL